MSEKLRDHDGREVRCVAPWLQTDPRECWIAEGCRYFNKLLRRCEHLERHTAELERAREENKPAGLRKENRRDD